MTIWAIVPVKPLRLGKSRLSEVLSDDERARLNRMFLERVLGILNEVEEIGQVLVVSRDAEALAIARQAGAKTVLEDGAQLLNLALQRATSVALGLAARGVLILPADLPLVTPQDIRRFIENAEEGPLVRIAPDRREDGTNALLVCPPAAIEYDYGPGSFVRHCELAATHGAQLEILRIPNLALDLDLPSDLELYRCIVERQECDETEIYT